MTKGRSTQKQAGSKIKTFPVPFSFEEKKENNTFNINNSTKYSKEQIIDKAIKFHLKGNILEAFKNYEYCINRGFNDHRVFSNYGAILKGLGRLKEAELSTRKAIELKPNNAKLHSNLGSILNNLGKLQEAEISTRKAIELKPNYSEEYSNLGNILRDLGRLKEAEIAQRKAIEIKPDSSNAYSNLGNVLRDLGRLKEAEIAQRKAIEIKPDFAIAHYNLGIILRDLGNLEEAEISQRKAIEIKPNFAIAHYNLGIILRDLGNLEEAKISYSKAISLKPDFKSALMNRWQLFFEEGEFDLALKDSNSCNTMESRVYSLVTLYALGRINEIYERIEKTSDLDEGNIRLAAFSSFITARENKETSNNFCKNPLSFLHFSNLKFHLKDHTEFIRETTKELYEFEAVWQPAKTTTHNGYQTPNNLNLFLNKSKNISQLKSIILNELDSYYLKFEKESCTYIKKWPLNKKIFGWHVILKKQGYQDSHIHPSGWLSGVIYLKVVPPLNKDEGAIEFSLNGDNYSDVNSPQLIYQPELGAIVLFPSSLHHKTIPFTTDTDRIVIAFDLMPN